VNLESIDYTRTTALVTGGSSGIGRAIAFELAARGVRKMAVDVREISIDLTLLGVQRQVETWGGQVDLLANVAGLSRKQLFAKDMETDVSLPTVDLMIKAVVDRSLRFLPPMVGRGYSGILNVSSTAAYNPVPFTAMHAASKAFMIS
jgi:short-subunit dehydrogenase